ncbi:MAG: hypothetical protein U0531_01105 [Dehalococcoidia bacterium]
MNAATLGRLRRRMMTDVAFRTRLRADFRRTLAEEQALDLLSEEQIDELYLGLMLRDALRMPDPRIQRLAPARPAAAQRAVAAGAGSPVSFDEWRSRRAAAGVQ